MPRLSVLYALILLFNITLPLTSIPVTSPQPDIVSVSTSAPPTRLVTSDVPSNDETTASTYHDSVTAVAYGQTSQSTANKGHLSTASTSNMIPLDSRTQSELINVMPYSLSTTFTRRLISGLRLTTANFASNIKDVTLQLPSPDRKHLSSITSTIVTIPSSSVTFGSDTRDITSLNFAPDTKHPASATTAPNSKYSSSLTSTLIKNKLFFTTTSAPHTKHSFTGNSAPNTKYTSSDTFDTDTKHSSPATPVPDTKNSFSENFDTDTKHLFTDTSALNTKHTFTATSSPDTKHPSTDIFATDTKKTNFTTPALDTKYLTTIASSFDYEDLSSIPETSRKNPLDDHKVIVRRSKKVLTLSVTSESPSETWPKDTQTYNAQHTSAIKNSREGRSVTNTGMVDTDIQTMTTQPSTKLSDTPVSAAQVSDPRLNDGIATPSTSNVTLSSTTTVASTKTITFISTDNNTPTLSSTLATSITTPSISEILAIVTTPVPARNIESETINPDEENDTTQAPDVETTTIKDVCKETGAVNLTVRSVTATSATLIIFAPEHTTHCYTSHHVVYKDVITKELINSNSPCTLLNECTLVQLLPCSTYNISVTSELQDRSVTSSVLVTTEDIEDPKPPMNVRWVSLKSHMINVTWTRNSNDEATRCVRHYIIQLGDRESIKDVEKTYQVLDNLVSCNNYSLTVWSSTKNNIMSRHEHETPVIIKEAPDLPSKAEYSLTYNKFYEVSLKWMDTDGLAPDNLNQCPVDRVSLTCVRDSIEVRKIEQTSKTRLTSASLVFRDLEPLRHYDCQGLIWHGAHSMKLYDRSFDTPDDDLHPVLVVFISCIAAIFSVLVIFGALLLLRRAYPERCRKLLDTLLGGIPLQQNVMAQCARPPSAIRTEVFEEHCAALAQSTGNPGNTGFTAQFRLLGALSPLPVSAQSEAYTAGMDSENRHKNRYINILPYDSTRVRVAEMDDDPCSDYVNANFIKGYSDEIEYIASQGPMECTCEDFWRMIFEHDVSIIAMVTNLEEKDKEKCYQYFPNLRETADFGSITVQSTSEVNLPIFTRRNLLIVKGDVNKNVLHLHFREWPDFGCPASTDLMLNFCHVMRQNVRDDGLILVHCSAGVGRTGTLIAVDILTQHIEKNNKIDVFGTVLKLRQQRINMVQTEGQYRYIHNCIKDALQDPSLLNPDLSHFNSMDPIKESCERQESDSFLAVSKADTGTTSDGDEEDMPSHRMNSFVSANLDCNTSDEEEENDELSTQEMDNFVVVKPDVTPVSEGESSL